MLDKADYYRGAALCQLLTHANCQGISFAPPFFVVNETKKVYMKYSTKIRTPWRFSFAPEELNQLHKCVRRTSATLALVCGKDGVAALDLSDALEIATKDGVAAWLACFRNHHKHYELRGPNGILARKIAPSDWLAIAGR